MSNWTTWAAAAAFAAAVSIGVSANKATADETYSYRGAPLFDYSQPTPVDVGSIDGVFTFAIGPDYTGAVDESYLRYSSVSIPGWGTFSGPANDPLYDSPVQWLSVTFNRGSIVNWDLNGVVEAFITFEIGKADDQVANVFDPSGSGSWNDTPGVWFAGVPEPTTWAMLILGLGVIGFAARRRNAGVALAA